MDAEKLLNRNDAEVEKLTRETIDRGGVLALLYFDLHANSKEVIQQLGASVVQKLLKEEGVVYAIGEIDEPIENQGLISSSVEVKLLVKSFASLVRICGNSSPISIEIVKPQEIKLPLNQAHDLLMNVSMNNYELKKLILEKVYTKDELEKFKKEVSGRLEVGKRIMGKKK